MKTLPFILFLLFWHASAYGQIITTIAGTGEPGYAGDGGPATNAKLNHPYCAILDWEGNMYIAEERNHVVRKVNTAGLITTIAGTGFGAGTSGGGYSGDGGQATNARLSRPTDLAFDKDGNLYITEAGNGTIRKVTPSGIISTFAGMASGGSLADGVPATSADLFNPLGLAFDTAGNLFFSPNGTFKVRKVNTHGLISTVAGQGMLSFSGDGGPATAAKVGLTGYLNFHPITGELYFGDYSNRRVRKIDNSNIITTIIGNGVNSNTGDGGPATMATVSNMWAVIFDVAGNMYLSDRSFGLIRKVSTSGIITTIAGTGNIGYGGDGGSPLEAKFDIEMHCSAIDNWGELVYSGPL